jgi:putative oxidoreductase
MALLSSHTPSRTEVLVSLFDRATMTARRFPDSILLAMGRVAIAGVFWNSAMSKLASWETTLALFKEEYRLPLLPNDVAAYLGTGTELVGAVLLFFGLGARFAALMLLGVTAVIQIFVYPESWVHHLQWATILLLVLVKGAGRASLDQLILSAFQRHSRAVR